MVILVPALIPLISYSFPSSMISLQFVPLILYWYPLIPVSSSLLPIPFTHILFSSSLFSSPVGTVGAVLSVNIFISSIFFSYVLSPTFPSTFISYVPPISSPLISSVIFAPIFSVISFSSYFVSPFFLCFIISFSILFCSKYFPFSSIPIVAFVYSIFSTFISIFRFACSMIPSMISSSFLLSPTYLICPSSISYFSVSASFMFGMMSLIVFPSSTFPS